MIREDIQEMFLFMVSLHIIMIVIGMQIKVARIGDGILPIPDIKDRSAYFITLTGAYYNDNL